MGGMSFNGLVGFVNELVWLVVGVLLIMWLWAQIQKDKNKK